MALFKVEDPKIVEFFGQRFRSVHTLPYDLWKKHFVQLEQPTWGQSYGYIRTMKNGCWLYISNFICVFTTHNKGMTMFVSPIGDYSDEENVRRVFRHCFKIMRKSSEEGYDCSIQISDVMKDHLGDGFKYVHKRKYHEHIYDTKLVSAMEGSGFKRIRNLIKKFKKTCPNMQIVPYDDSMYDQAIMLRKIWHEEVKDKYFMFNDAFYYKSIMENWKEYGHEILCVVNEGELIGIVSGERLSDDRSFCFIRKSLKAYEGLSEFLVWLICDNFKDTMYLNDGEDNTEGLKFFKSKFKSKEVPVIQVMGVKEG